MDQARRDRVKLRLQSGDVAQGSGHDDAERARQKRHRGAASNPALAGRFRLRAGGRSDRGGYQKGHARAGRRGTSTPRGSANRIPATFSTTAYSISRSNWFIAGMPEVLDTLGRGKRSNERADTSVQSADSLLHRLAKECFERVED